MCPTPQTPLIRLKIVLTEYFINGHIKRSVCFKPVNGILNFPVYLLSTDLWTIVISQD